jgi:cobalt-zinc-cadmium efflux system membrane fusion protein
MKVRVVLTNAKHTLKSDMFATIRVPGALRTACIRPATAVLHEGEKTFVFLQDASGKFNQRVVTVGRSIDSGPVKNIEVLTGLNDGDKVVSIGGALLRQTSGE